jgi:hypothetical protein
VATAHTGKASSADADAAADRAVDDTSGSGSGSARIDGTVDDLASAKGGKVGKAKGKGKGTPMVCRATSVKSSPPTLFPLLVLVLVIIMQYAWSTPRVHVHHQPVHVHDLTLAPYIL